MRGPENGVKKRVKKHPFLGGAVSAAPLSKASLILRGGGGPPPPTKIYRRVVGEKSPKIEVGPPKKKRPFFFVFRGIGTQKNTPRKNTVFFVFFCVFSCTRVHTIFANFALCAHKKTPVFWGSKKGPFFGLFRPPPEMGVPTPLEGESGIIADFHENRTKSQTSPKRPLFLREGRNRAVLPGVARRHPARRPARLPSHAGCLAVPACSDWQGWRGVACSLVFIGGTPTNRLRSGCQVDAELARTRRR